MSVRGESDSIQENVLRATVNAAADGDNTLIAAAGAGQSIKVLGLAVTVLTTGLVIFKSAAVEIARFHVLAGTPLVLPLPGDDGAVPWLETTDNAALVVTNAAGVDTAGVVLYIVEPA